MANKKANTKATTKAKKPATRKATTKKKPAPPKESKTKVKQYTKTQKNKFLEVLQKKDGHISKACTAYGIDRKTYYNWMKEDWFAEEVENIREKEIDDAEEIARMMRKGVPIYARDKNGNIKKDGRGQPIVEGWLVKPDSKMVRHFLDTQGKDRGYGKQTQVDLNIHKMPDDVQIGLKVHKKGK